MRNTGVAVSVAAAVTGIAGVAGANPAAASVHTLKLNYQCEFPLLGPQQVQVTMSSDIPETVPPKTPIPKIVVDTVSTVGEKSAQGLREVGAKTLEGTASAEAVVQAPQGDLPVKVPVTLESTTLPASGGFDIKATGSAPPIQFSKEGTAKIVVNNLLLTLTPKLADGTLTGLDTFESECTQEPGQDNVLATIGVKTEGGGGDEDTVAPSIPQNVTATATTSSAALSWEASTDNVGVTGYEVYDGSGKKVADTTTTSAVVSGLQADTQYTFTVKAKDAAGNLSDASTAVAVKTPSSPGGDTPVNYSFALAGSTFVKAPNGTAPLVGAIDASLDLKTKSYTADLALNPTSGNFSILGFLPVTAGIEIVPQGKVTGTLNGPLKADVNVITKLPSFSLFGVIPLGGGDKCQTKDPSAIHLESDGTFNPLKGGKISGTYKLSEIQDCNLLTPILSAFTAGDGNTLDLNLTPQAKA
ncbi:fibronectin type III domain-containing protein [Actinomadura atramentaria]|uniref:fibronectin type III domain-containing protein n=1 Tax=Actinomadura atramentaria TaxID=1990 RepID=UPI00036F3E93|nr:fibronectin type III domain-containing protein [Actinomadura atramentaria]